MTGIHVKEISDFFRKFRSVKSLKDATTYMYSCEAVEKTKEFNANTHFKYIDIPENEWRFNYYLHFEFCLGSFNGTYRMLMSKSHFAECSIEPLLVDIQEVFEYLDFLKSKKYKGGVIFFYYGDKFYIGCEDKEYPIVDISKVDNVQLF